MKKIIYTFALGLLAAPIMAQIPNAGFENWDSLTILNGVRIYNPVDWNSSNVDRVDFNSPQTIEMTTDAHSGSYAVKLTSALNDNSEQATFLNSGNSIGETPNDPNADKFPLNGRINGFEGYYKYFPNGNDQFRIFLALYRNGLYIGQAYITTARAADVYTKFWWPVIFPGSIAPPDSGKFIIEASVYDDSEGSVLYLDDLNLTYGFATALNEVQKPEISLYPNPATDEIVLLGYDPRYHYKYLLTTIDGKLIQSETLTTEKLQIDFLDNGLYFLTLTDEVGNTHQLKFAKYE
jgi:hypothetical protein